MPRRISLPVAFDPRMTLAHARERLGGRVPSHGDAGRVVAVDHAGETHVGVILWSDETTCDVWLEDDRTKRTALESVTTISVADGAMAEVASDARAFAALSEGADVSFDAHESGRLVEKCRWGALVAKRDGRIFAVGFRRFSTKKN